MLTYAIEIIGWAAAALLLSAYLLVTAGKISARSRLYQWMNVFSAAGLIVNSGWNGAYPSAAINIAWMIIAVYGVLSSRTRPGAAA